MESVRTGIIGCGKVGAIHAEALRALPESKLVAFCDAQLSRAQAFADRYGGQAFDSVTGMLANSGLEAVTICTPHPLHEEPCVLAAAAGVHGASSGAAH